jgi:transketolase
MLLTAPDHEARLAIDTIKTLAIDAVEKAQSGHPGTPMGLADMAFEIWANALRHDPQDPRWVARDRFVLSCGHASMLIYSLLHLTGYNLTLDDLKAFRQWGSKTPGHPEVHDTEGVETTTGPLGQGISNAVGFALSGKMRAARFGSLFDFRTYVLASDGDIMEGISSEAASLAGHLKLSNLVVFYDDNRITIEGDTSLAFSEDVAKRYESYGWRVYSIDGHDRAQIRDVLSKVENERERPVFVVARTHIANGAPNAHDTHESHGAPLGADEIAATKRAMGWDPAASFFVPEEVKSFFAQRRTTWAEAHRTWNERYAAWRAEDPTRAAQYDAFERRALPEDLLSLLIAAVPTKDDATRGLSNVIQQKVAELVPGLVGGSADLAGSTKTLIKGAKSIGPDAYDGRNFHFGIREHGMGALCNGLALAGGFIPYGATFLVFSDYMRPSVRLSAFMHLPTIWIFTHDSIFLGEDGPTHQPIEHLWALRLIPGLSVFRPADGLETAAGWAYALERGAAGKGPTAFSLTRQKVPTLKRPSGFDPKDILRGAYVVSEAEANPEVVILATGSEVATALEAKEALQDKAKVRVVSVPCLEAFAAQDAAYREKVLPPSARKVSIEAGRTGPWREWVGADGLCVGLDEYGRSAPDKVLAERFGLTGVRVADRIRAAGICG